MKHLNKNINFETYIIKYLKREENFIKESSHAIYSAHTYNKIIPFLGNYQLKELNSEHLQDFMTYLQLSGNSTTTKGLALSSCKAIMTFLKGSLDYLFKQNVIKSFDTSIKTLASTYNPPLKVFTEFEIIILRDYLKQNLTNRNLGILLALYTGIRIGELCALTWDDINLIENKININKTLQRINVITYDTRSSKIIITSPKSVKSNRKVPIHNELIGVIKQVKDPHGYLLSDSDIPVEPRALRYHFNRILISLGIKKRPFHSLRHTFATRLIKNTNDFKTVSELLGHSSIAITLDIYTHTSDATKYECINKF